MRISLAVALALSAAAALAQPVVTSVSPSSGPVTGGTQVTIKGSGFNDPCAPPRACPVKGLNVYFGNDLAASSTLVDAQTVVAVTAPHLPEPSSVWVCQLDGCAPSPFGAFTFLGDPGDAFERILLPIFLPPTHGAFGSLFVTSFEMWNKFDSPDIAVYGVPFQCTLPCVPIDQRIHYALPHGDNAAPIQPVEGTPGKPGHMLYVPKDRAAAVASSLRVYDQSRVSTTLGTEIPVVHDHDFHADTIALLGVPLDSRFRNTLRIYSASPAETDVKLTIGDSSSVVHLAPGNDLFHPATATSTTFPSPPSVSSDASIATSRVTIEPLVAGTRIWAFISVTNNDTQQITVISPQ